MQPTQAANRLPCGKDLDRLSIYKFNLFHNHVVPREICTSIYDIAIFNMDSDMKKTPNETHVDFDAGTINADDARLAQLGHTQELNRQFSLLALGALCVCLMGTWEALSTVVATALASGGAPCLFYNLYVSTRKKLWP
jgi:hypothetical protein